MTSQNSSAQNQSQSIVIKPMHRLPIIIIAVGIGTIFLPIKHWPGLLLSGFGVFLLVQSFTLKLKLTANELIVMQLGQELRRFPFENWIAWRILLPNLPGLLYFREKVSPHLLPLLFDPEMLKQELRSRVGELEINHESSSNTPSNN